MILLHGYCEHRGRYRHVAERLAKGGYRVFTADLRGHGESGGARAHVMAFADYLDDVRAIIQKAQSVLGSAQDAQNQAPRSIDDRPILIGHSMGGLVALRYALQSSSEELRALVMSSPFLGLKAHVPAWKRYVGRAASRLVPRLALPNDLSAADLSHDPAVAQAYASDPLVSHIATARWFTEALGAQAEVLRMAPRLRLPTLLMQGGDDRIADAAVSRTVFDRLGADSAHDKQFILYPNLFHEIFNEVENDRVLTDMTAWLKDR